MFIFLVRYFCFSSSALFIGIISFVYKFERVSIQRASILFTSRIYTAHLMSYHPIVHIHSKNLSFISVKLHPWLSAHAEVLHKFFEGSPCCSQTVYRIVSSAGEALYEVLSKNNEYQSYC